MTSEPEGIETSSEGVVSPNYALRGFEGCLPDQVAAIKNGYSDMITMVNNDMYNYPKVDWNSGAAQDYWGPAERNRKYRDHIVANLDRLASVTYNWWFNPFAKRIHARCDDPRHQCPCDVGGMTAYTIDHKPEINFCPRYFTLPTLGDVKKYPLQGRWDWPWYYFNRAAVWVHELMHVKEIGKPWIETRDGIIDQPVSDWPGREGEQAYGPTFTKWLAQDPWGVYDEVVENADNYAYFVMTNYLQSKLGFYPSQPQVPVEPQGRNGFATSSESEGNDTDIGISGRCASY